MFCLFIVCVGGACTRVLQHLRVGQSRNYLCAFNIFIARTFSQVNYFEDISSKLQNENSKQNYTSFTKSNPRISICQFQRNWWPCVYPLNLLTGLHIARDIQAGLYLKDNGGFSAYPCAVILSITVIKYPNLGVSNTTVLTCNSGQQNMQQGSLGQKTNHWGDNILGCSRNKRSLASSSSSCLK